MLFRWLRRREEMRLLAIDDARTLIARYGVRASHMAQRRVTEMQGGTTMDANRPMCHWRRVHKLTRQLLPYDGPEVRSPVLLSSSRLIERNAMKSEVSRAVHK